MRAASTTTGQSTPLPTPTSPQPPAAPRPLRPRSAQTYATTTGRACDKWTRASVLFQPGLVLHPRQVLLHRRGRIRNGADRPQPSAREETQAPAGGEKQQRDDAVTRPRRPSHDIRERAAERDAEQHYAEQSDNGSAGKGDRHRLQS